MFVSTLLDIAKRVEVMEAALPYYCGYGRPRAETCSHCPRGAIEEARRGSREGEGRKQ